MDCSVKFDRGIILKINNGSRDDKEEKAVLVQPYMEDESWPMREGMSFSCRTTSYSSSSRPIYWVVDLGHLYNIVMVQLTYSIALPSLMVSDLKNNGLGTKTTHGQTAFFECNKLNVNR